MDEDAWARVDGWLAEKTGARDPATDAILAASTAAGLPAIELAPTHAKLLHILARIAGARRILEIGTLGGYSTAWLARALPPGGRLVTLEANPQHADVARENLERAGLAAAVELRVGPALDTLPALEAEAPFDLIFVDADKPANPEYLAWALRLSRPGTLIVFDNVVRSGRVIDAGSTDPSILGTRRLFDLIAAEPRLTATAVQTVGAKGWDGFAIALVD